MNTATLIALVDFAFVTSITPGPNNMMLLATGANFGFRRGMPHLLGVSIGHAFLVLVVGLGLAGLYARFPQLQLALKVAAVAYMLWLALKIARSGRPEAKAAGGRPIRFFEAAAFQWVNPKGWFMAITAATSFAQGEGAGAAFSVAVPFLLVNLPSCACWLGLGQGMQRLLTNDWRLRAFNFTMAALLLASLVPILLH